ncbi:hypothetical protein EYV94_22210 [Puteibacter caeruleilacunae]|nr:hypothetical protein EYV94_22210 [Puteibacter caeruleilacunae]
MKKSIIFICMLVCSIAYNGFAQKRKADVVYLKNGSVVRGSIEKTEPGKKIHLRTKDHSLWVFSTAEIDSITKELKQPLIKPHIGYFNLSEFGVLAGSSDNEQKAPFSFVNINGYQFANRIALGAGVGIEFLEEAYMPVFADVRYVLSAKKIAPFCFAQGGYLVPLEDADSARRYYYSYMSFWPGPAEQVDVDTQGGMMFNGGIGARCICNENLTLMLSVGYRYNRLRYDREDHYLWDVDYNRFSLKLGILFK